MKSNSSKDDDYGREAHDNSTEHNYTSLQRSKEIQRLAHELYTHQVELEMQNDELLNAQTALAAALDQFTYLYDFAPVGYFTLELDGAISRLNLTGAALVGEERSKLVGRRFGLFITPDCRTPFSRFLKKVFASHAKETCEVTLEQLHGPCLYVHVEARALENEQACLVALLDMTKRKEAEETARKEQARQLEIHISAVATLREQRHDILNELSLISAYVQVGKKDEALQCIESAAAHFSNKYSYRMLPCEAWMTVIGVKRSEAAEMGVHFSLNLEAEAPRRLREQTLLPSLIGNLVDNAFGAAKQTAEPRVSLRWYTEGGFRVLSVANNGPKIPIAVLDKILQTDYTSKREDGHGWGLIICKRIVADLGGRFSASSTAKGTVFVVRLPLQ